MSVRGEVASDLDETWGNSSYKPPGASYTAQGPLKYPENIKSKIVSNYEQLKTNNIFPYAQALIHVNLIAVNLLDLLFDITRNGSARFRPSLDTR